MNQLIEIQKPSPPADWNYEKSVEMLRGLMFRWKNLSIEIVRELSIARELLSISKSEAAKIMHGTKVPCKTWSDYCRDIGSSRQVVNRWLKNWLPEDSTPLPTLPPPDGSFDVIYADPPWSYRFQIKRGLASEHYPTMSTEDICNLTVPSTDDTVLFLWVTNPLLSDGLQVINAWGFDYKTNLVWVKDRFGVGHYVRGQHELLLLSVKGKIGTPEPSEAPSSVVEAPRQEHSRKPAVIYSIIERMYPNRKYLELFARKQHPGWAAWGNQLERNLFGKDEVQLQV